MAERKIVIDKAGGYERLRVIDAAPLAPGAGDVVIEVHASGVNYADCMVRMGLYDSASEFVGWPITPGFEVAGVVRAVGSEVADLAPGDRVFAVTLFNGYASEVRASRPYVFRMPDGLDFAQAAGMPAVFLSAYYALFELAHPRPKTRALIHSAAGGVGGSLVELCKIAGCEVTAVVGASHKVEVARAHGADHVIDKSSEPLWPAAERAAQGGYDLICDANGRATLADSYAHLRRSGKLVIYGFHSMIPRKGGKPNWLKLGVDFLRTPRFNPFELTNKSISILAFNLSYLFDRLDILEEAMTRIAGWLAEGKIHPPPVKSYPFDEVARAHRDIESGQTVGKLVLALR